MFANFDVYIDWPKKEKRLLKTTQVVDKREPALRGAPVGSDPTEVDDFYRTDVFGCLLA